MYNPQPLKLWIFEQGLSQSKISLSAGFNYQTVNMFVNGKKCHYGLHQYFLSIGCPEEILPPHIKEPPVCKHCPHHPNNSATKDAA